jgi:hypothetical protein
MSLKIKERMLIATLRDSNVYKIQLSYSGGGDDGCIDDVEALDHNDKPIHSVQIQKAIDGLDDYFYELLNDYITYDWINNEGGNGHATFYLTNLKFEIDHYQNFQENFQYEDKIDGPPVIT